MTDEQLSEKISKSATKLVMRKYPFIMSGDFIGTFQPEYTYRTGFKFQEDAKITGIKTILLVNPEIFFDMFGYNDKPNTYNTIMKGNLDYTIKYLSTIYNRSDPQYLEISKIDDDILKYFYEAGNVMDSNNQLGFLDFFIRFAFMGSNIGEWDGFLDSDIAIVPTSVK
jgi:hypothetical protein